MNFARRSTGAAMSSIKPLYMAFRYMLERTSSAAMRSRLDSCRNLNATLADTPCAMTNATGGTFTLTFNGQTTPTPFTWDAPAGVVESALDALSIVPHAVQGNRRDRVPVALADFQTRRLARRLVVVVGMGLHDAVPTHHVGGWAHFDSAIIQ